jgi:hypothetical protein
MSKSPQITFLAECKCPEVEPQKIHLKLLAVKCFQVLIFFEEF